MPEEVLLNTFSPPKTGLGAGDGAAITSSGTSHWHGVTVRAGGTATGRVPRCGRVGQPPQLGLRKHR